MAFLKATLSGDLIKHEQICTRIDSLYHFLKFEFNKSAAGLSQSKSYSAWSWTPTKGSHTRTIMSRPSDANNQQQFWIRPRFSPPLLSTIPYGLQRPSPPPSSLSDNAPSTPSLSPVALSLDQHSVFPDTTPVQPKHCCKHQLTQTQVLDMDDDILPSEPERLETLSWCSLDLCLSDAISLPSENQPDADYSGMISETILSRPMAVRESSNSCIPSRSGSYGSKLSALKPRTENCLRPGCCSSQRPPTPVVVTPPSSPTHNATSSIFVPSIQLSEDATAKNMPPPAPEPIKPKSKIKTRKSLSQKDLNPCSQKRPKTAARIGLLFESITFLLTGFSGSAFAEQRTKLTEAIKSLGGHISKSNSVIDCVNLKDESDSLVRIVIVNDLEKETWTTKLFYTLMRGVPAVDTRWIEDSRRQNKIMPLHLYARQFGDAFLRGNSHLPKERRQRPLSGRKIAYFGINKEEFVSIIHTGGASAQRQQSKADLIILSETDLPSSIIKNRILQAEQAGIPVVNLQWLKEAVLTQSFPNVHHSPHRLDIGRA